MEINNGGEMSSWEKQGKQSRGTLAEPSPGGTTREGILSLIEPMLQGCSTEARAAWINTANRPQDKPFITSL